MKEVKDITVCVVDDGLNLTVARTLAKTVKRVLYATPSWETAFPTIEKCIIGDGFSDIERCDDIWSAKKEVDMFAFPDIHHGGLQTELAEQGFAVWGSRHGDKIETDRELFHSLLEKLGLQVPPHRVIVGLTKLRIWLQEHDGPRYIKISKFRGTLETKKWRGWDLDNGLLDQWAVKFGPTQDLIPFIVCDPIDTDLEPGGDTYNIDGQFPTLMMNGYEWKDAGYFGTVTPVNSMPKQIVEVMDAFSTELKKLLYRNFWSCELRIKGRKSYFIDPCHRCSLPGTASRMVLFSNIADIMWKGANGILVEPEPIALMSAECLMTIKGKNSDWLTTELPPKLADAMHFSNACEVDGRICLPPDDDRCAIGWLCATGDSIEDTIDELHGFADELPDGVDADTDSLVGLLSEIKKGEEAGLPFSDQEIPEPETALNI